MPIQQGQAELATMLENIEISRHATLEHFVYFMHTPNDQNLNILECVSVVDEYHAITYRHIDHQDYTKGQQITIQKCIDPEKRVKVEVHETQEWEYGDFMLLRTVGDEKFEHYPIGVREAKPAEKCWIATPSLEHNSLRFLYGTVKQKQGHIFMSVTTPGSQGDSGAGVYSANEGRFIGMVVGRRNILVIGDYSDIKFVNAYPLVLKFTGKLDKEDPLNSLAKIRGSSIHDFYGYHGGNGPTYSPCVPWSAHHGSYKEPTYTPTCGNVNGSWKTGSPGNKPMLLLNKETQQTEVSTMDDENDGKEN